MIDHGVQLNHPDLNGRISGDNPIASQYNHGTRVAGIIGAIWDNNIGIKGVNKYSPIISSNKAERPFSEIAEALVNLANQDAKVINHSYGTVYQGGEHNALTYRLTLAYLTQLGIINVGITHNNGQQFSSQPSSFKGVIAVGGTQNNDAFYSNSNYGHHVDVVAPAGFGSNPTNQNQNIYSTSTNSSYSWDVGTSFAAPQVTGLASLMQGYYKEYYNNYIDVDDMEGLIRNSADKVRQDLYTYTDGFNIRMGYGRINMRKALDFIRSPYVMTKSSIITGGGSSTWIGNNVCFITGANGLPNYVYSIKKYAVTKTVNYSLNPNVTEKYFWGNGKGVTGWYHPDPDVIAGNLGHCEVVPGSVTSNTITLRTYVYEVWTLAPNGGQGDYKGWFPSTPSNTTFKYTMLYKDPNANELNFGEESMIINNFPNPFNPSTKIKYSLKNESNIKIVVYDIMGREIKTLVNEYKLSGNYSVDFDGSNLSSGMYFYKLVSNDNTLIVKKMLLIK